jgi:hypothetical protein
MPPHCDSLDGPVVRAAQAALDAQDVDMVTPYVPEAGEAEVLRAFDLAVTVRGESPRARALADRYFFETVVRVHRAGEGAPYTGLKPAGLDVGPVIPLAERAIETGDDDALVALLTATVEQEMHDRLAHVMHLRPDAGAPVAQARAYVQAMLALQVWAHGLYQAARASAHDGNHVYEPESAHAHA